MKRKSLSAKRKNLKNSIFNPQIRNKRIRAAFDVFWKEPYDGKLNEFKKKVKTNYEIVSIYSNKDIKKIKKLLIKYAN